jgi:predicted short-subunit dehydrogenase-like oxidoreductase (DUF2520 family)
MKLALLGQGRAGSTLNALLQPSTFSVQPWRRGEPIPEADVYWLLVPDSAIAEVAAQLPRGAIVLHASGALDANVLSPHDERGTLHPAASFPGLEVIKPTLTGVRAIVTGTPRARAAGRTIAEALGMVPVEFDGDLRLYHAACVLAGNFTTVLFNEAIRVAMTAGLNREDALAITGTLASATLENARRVGPQDALTGPFARGDAKIVSDHRNALGQKLPDALPLYDALASCAIRLADDSGRPIEDFRNLIRTDRQRSDSDGDV